LSGLALKKLGKNVGGCKTGTKLRITNISSCMLSKLLNYSSLRGREEGYNKKGDQWSGKNCLSGKRETYGLERLGDNYSKGDQPSGRCCLSGKRETLWGDRGINIVKETSHQGDAASQGRGRHYGATRG